MELYIVRHGVTSWNVAKRFQGATDIELNDDGRKLAVERGRDLADISFDRAYSSPLIRAYETATLMLGDRNLVVVKDERLKEISFGEMEGCYHEQWNDSDKPYRFFFSAPEKYSPPPKGDTIQSVCDRTKDFIINEIEPLYGSCDRVILFAHGGVNAAIRCYLEDHGVKDFWNCGVQKNCEAIIYHFDGTSWSR